MRRIGSQSIVNGPILLAIAAIIGLVVWLTVKPVERAKAARPTVVSPISISHLPPFHRPFVAGGIFPFQSSVDSLSGHPALLARGRRATVIMAIAPGSAVCGYEVQYVVPALAQMPGAVVDLVDVEPVSGIAAAGPQAPAFHGLNAAGHPISMIAMAALMRRYAQRYHLARYPAIHVYVASTQTQQAWGIHRLPTWGIMNAQGRVVIVPAGAVTAAAGMQILDSAI